MLNINTRAGDRKNKIVYAGFRRWCPRSISRGKKPPVTRRKNL